MRKEEINDSIIPKLRMIQNKPITYKQLCEALEIGYKSSNSKSHQLNQISLYCDLDVVDNPTRYIVNKVYDGAIISQIHGNNKYQDLFEGALYQALLNNNGRPLYLSNMEMLTLFNEVNENFSYSCNEYYMNFLGGEYITLNEMSQIAYKILREWTRRRMKQMEARKVILTRQGFRLYSYIDGINIMTNVEADSDKEKMCQEIYDKAAKETLPDDWHGEWVQAWRWEEFEDKVRELVQEYFNGTYSDLKPITIVSPPRAEYLKEILSHIYDDTPELKDINNEACNKLFSTSQLKEYTDDDRKMLVDISIRDDAEISLKKKIDNKNKRMAN